MRLAVLALLLALAASVAAQASPDVAAAARVAKAATDGFIRPAYAGFRKAADALSTRSAALCRSPSAPALEAARHAFADAALAWSRAEIVGFGPVTAENRRERLLFWPDRKGIGLKQVQAILAAKDPAAIAGVAGKSVAAQGFPALEFALFGTGAERLSGPDEAFRCGFAAAVSDNIAGIAAGLDREWADPDGIAQRWAMPGPDNPDYRSADETTAEAIDTVLHGLELVRDVRFSFLGGKAADDRPKQALYWRSGLSVAALKASMQALSDFAAASGLAGLTDTDYAWIGPSAAFEFGNAATAFDAVASRPLDAVLADPRLRNRLAYARIVTSSLSEIVGVRLTAALGISAGFSSLDGD